MKGWISPGTNKLVSPSLFHSPVAVAAVGLKLQEHHFSTRLDLKRTNETMLQHFTCPLDYIYFQTLEVLKHCWLQAEQTGICGTTTASSFLHLIGAASPFFRCAQMVPPTHSSYFLSPWIMQTLYDFQTLINPVFSKLVTSWWTKQNSPLSYERRYKHVLCAQKWCLLVLSD